MNEIFETVQRAGRELLRSTENEINEVLAAVADAIEQETPMLLEANAKDLARMDERDPKYDRLKLTADRLHGIAGDMRQVAKLPSPLGRVLKQSTLPNGLRLRRVSVPFGVIGVVYEARPNVTFDVFSLCLKSGSACILKGGSDAECSNQAAVKLIREVLRRYRFNPHTLELLPATHEAVDLLLHARDYVDLIIPRGGKRLIDFVRQNSTVPVIETGAGVCHAFFDRYGDVEKGIAIINNAKTRRVSVCNALDCLIIDLMAMEHLPALCAPLAANRVQIYADEPAYQCLKGVYPDEWLHLATADDYGCEYLDYKMAIKSVDDEDEAIDHIRRYGSKHSECIITEDDHRAARFVREVDAACVYVNAPTSFTDGAQFGLGAEIGISTQKLHARGPMGLEEITTYKWVIEGEGQTRP